MTDRCPICDRAECQRWHHERAAEAVLLVEDRGSDDWGKEVRARIRHTPACESHRVDWRVRCFAAEAERDALRGRGLTVGAALALPEVQDGSHVVEYRHGTAWYRLAGSGLVRWGDGDGRWRWDDGTMWLDAYAVPCRLVPISEADRDPNDRGAL